MNPKQTIVSILSASPKRPSLKREMQSFVAGYGDPKDWGVDSLETVALVIIGLPDTARQLITLEQRNAILAVLETARAKLRQERSREQANLFKAVTNSDVVF